MLSSGLLGKGMIVRGNGGKCMERDEMKMSSLEREGNWGLRCLRLVKVWGMEVLVVLVCMVFLGIGVSQKEGFHMDELLSFELANGEFNPWIVPTQPEGRLAKFVHNEIDGGSFGETVGNLKDVVVDVLENRGASKLLSYKADVFEEPVWIGRDAFQDYITVDGEDDFNYLSVYFNVKDDNHPPVHFMLLHTISSLFQGKASPVMGCIINMVFVAGCMVLLMCIGRLLAQGFGMPERGRLLGLFAAALYGCSAGAMATTLLIRMYGTMTFFCVAFFYFHVKKWLEKGFDKNNKLLVLVTVLGFLTQYFFLFYCLVLAAATVVLLWCNGRRKELFCYVRSMVIAAVIGIGCFPFAVSDVFSSGRGVEALDNLTSGFAGYGSRIAAFASILSDRTFDIWVVVLLAFMGVVWHLKYGREAAKNIVIETGSLEQSGKKIKKELLWMLLLPMLVYFLLAARMSPYLVDRYIMPLFPFVALAVALFLILFAHLLEKHSGEKYIFHVTCGAVLAMQLVHLGTYDGAYLYQGYDKQRQVAEQYEQYPCICVYDGVGYYENLQEFTYYDKTLLLKETELAQRNDVESIAQLDKVIVLVKQPVDWEPVFEILNQKYGLSYEEELLENSVYGDRVFLFGR